MSGALLNSLGTMFVEIQFDRVNWTDVTTDVQIESDNLTISQGRSDETSQAQPASCRFTLLNTAGNYTAYDPRSSFYPNVTRGTPVRVRFDRGGGPVVIFQGYAAGFTPAWNTTASVATVVVNAAGTLRRLTQGSTPLRSPLYRAVTNVNRAAVGYWPFEDGSAATAPVAAVSGTQPLIVNKGTVTLGITEGVDPGSTGAGSIVNLGSALMSRNAATANGWTIAFAFKLTPTNPATYTADLVAFTANTNQGISGKPVGFRLSATKSAGVSRLDLFDDAGTSYTTAFTADLGDSKWHTIVIAATAGLAGTFTLNSIFDGTLFSTSYSLGSSGRINRFGVGPDYTASWFDLYGTVSARTAYASTLTDVQMMHVAIFDGGITPGNLDYASALSAYSGESPDTRISRICGEESIPITLTGTSDKQMGPQPSNVDLVSLLHDCENVDGGVLFDGFDTGLRYTCLSSRYNQSGALFVNTGAGQLGQPFEPVDDDQRTRNSYTASRPNGGSTNYTQTAGALGTTQVGVYDSSGTFNTQDDTPLDEIASWQVHLGTVEGFRYPTLNLDFGAQPSLIASWLATGKIGFRVDVGNPASEAPQHPQGAISLIVEGYTMTIDQATWTVTCNCSPEQPYEVFKLDDANRGRLDTDGSALASLVSAGATSLSVNITAGPLWTTAGGDMPFDIDLGGEQVTVTAISGLASPQTFTVTRAINGLSIGHGAGTAVKLWRAETLAL